MLNSHTGLVANSIGLPKSRVWRSLFNLRFRFSVLSSKRSNLTTLPEMTVPNYFPSHEPFYFLHRTSQPEIFSLIHLFTF